jgi:hypothetical protein
MADKITKRDYFAQIRELIENTVEDAAYAEELIGFVDAQVALLDKRNAAAKVRAEKKREESDALTDAIYGILTDELQTVDAIVEALDTEGVTRNKVTARLGKLVKAGKVAKETVKVEDAKRMAYRLATDEDAAEVAED